MKFLTVAQTAIAKRPRARETPDNRAVKSDQRTMIDANAAGAAATDDIRAYGIIASFARSGGVTEENFDIHCSATNDRQPSTNEAIDTIWKDRVRRNPSLFNGTKFRFSGVRQSAPMHEKIIIDLGITCYKDFLGTNCAPHWHDLGPENLASPLGNAAIVETIDQKVVLLKRSQNVGECPDTIVCPGGHAEPEMVGIKRMEDWESDSTDRNETIRHELFDSMVREVVEETGIPKYKLGSMKCIGFTERVVNKRPDIIFHILCSITAEEVHKLYTDGPEHEYESTELITMNRDEFLKKVLDDNSINMPGCHRGGVALYRDYIAYQNDNV